MTQTQPTTNEKAQAIARLHPGISLSRFAVKMGFNLELIHKDRTNPTVVVSDEASEFVWNLQKAGVIDIAKPDKLHGEARIYLPGAIPAEKPLFVPSPHKARTECTVRVDPSVKEPIDYPKGFVSHSDCYRRIMDAIADMKRAGAEISMMQLCKSAEISQTYLNSKGKWAVRAREAYDAAIAEIKSNRFAGLDPAIKAQLEQRVKDVEECNRQLRQQLADLQSQAPTPQIIELDPLTFLYRNRDKWKATVERIRTEMQQAISQLEIDLNAAQQKLTACELLIESYRDEVPEVPNRNGNGVLVKA